MPIRNGMPMNTKEAAAAITDPKKNSKPAATRPWHNCPRPGQKNDSTAASIFSTPGLLRCAANRRGLPILGGKPTGDIASGVTDGACITNRFEQDGQRTSLPYQSGDSLTETRQNGHCAMATE